MKHIITTSQTCSGCTACASVCPKQVISFSYDAEGFQVPIIDEANCIECGICVDTCPAIKASNNNNVSNKKYAYAFKYDDNSVKLNSASGALFPSFANYFINTLNAYVCGCVLDADRMPKHVISNKWEDVMLMQDSKYVQSNMGNTIAQIGDLLKNGNYILFTGTSCQVAGLIESLNKKKISTDRLLTIDFFCHGVPSPMIWQNYIKYYEETKNRKVVGFRFRNKDYGWGKGPGTRGASFLSSIWYIRGDNSNNKLHRDNISFLARIWPRIFFSNLCIRRYCHLCPYANINKPSDITMGDFWGIQELYPKFDDKKGCSLAIIHNSKAMDYLHNLANTELLEVSISDVIKKQGNAFCPSVPHPQREQFWKDYKMDGISNILPKYFNYTRLGRIVAFFKYILFKLHLRRYTY